MRRAGQAAHSAPEPAPMGCGPPMQRGSAAAFLGFSGWAPFEGGLELRGVGRFNRTSAVDPVAARLARSVVLDKFRRAVFSVRAAARNAVVQAECRRRSN